MDSDGAETVGGGGKRQRTEDDAGNVVTKTGFADRTPRSASIWKVENLFFNVCPALQHEPQTTVNGYVEVGGYIPTVADPLF